MSDEKETPAPAPLGFIVNPELSYRDAMSNAHCYIDTIERALTHLATVDNSLDDAAEIDAPLWALSYVAQMAKAMVYHAHKNQQKEATP